MTTEEVYKNKDSSPVGTHYDDLLKLRSEDRLFCPCCSKRLRNEVDVIEHVKEETCYRIVPHPHSTKLAVALLRDTPIDFEGPGFKRPILSNEPTFLQQKSRSHPNKTKKSNLDVLVDLTGAKTVLLCSLNLQICRNT